MILLSDTDFLGSFLKIGQLEAVRDFYLLRQQFLHALIKIEARRLLPNRELLEALKHAPTTACDGTMRPIRVPLYYLTPGEVFDLEKAA